MQSLCPPSHAQLSFRGQRNAPLFFSIIARTYRGNHDYFSHTSHIRLTPCGLCSADRVCTSLPHRRDNYVLSCFGNVRPNCSTDCRTEHAEVRACFQEIVRVPNSKSGSALGLQVGAWCSDITSASDVEGPGLKSQGTHLAIA